MKKKIRKITPQPPRWAWYDLDNCYFCKNQNNCGNCKVMKAYKVNASIKERNISKNKLRKYKNKKQAD